MESFDYNEKGMEMSKSHDLNSSNSANQKDQFIGSLRLDKKKQNKAGKRFDDDEEVKKHKKMKSKKTKKYKNKGKKC